MPDWVKDIDTFLLYFEQVHGTHAARMAHNIICDHILLVAISMSQSIVRCQFYSMTQPSVN